MKKLLFFCSLLILGISVYSQNHNTVRQDRQLIGLENGTLAFADYDNDGDMDLLVMGTDSLWYSQSQLYNNTGTGLVFVSTGIDDLSGSSADWGDFDNDGDEDLLLTGYTNDFFNVTSIYRNDGNDNFTFYLDAPGVSNGMAKWCDFNNDGFLDVIVTGSSSTAIYQNYYYDFYYTSNTNIFSCSNSALDCGDYDNDGDMDIIVSGATTYNPETYEPLLPEIRLFKNNGNFNFTQVSTNLPAICDGSVKFGDYDNDGDLDLLIAGKNAQRIAITQIFRNDNGSFTNINAGLTGIIKGNAAWGDLDADGKLDVLLTGGTSVSAEGYLEGATSQAYFNNGNDLFVNANYDLYPSSYSTAALADLDGNHTMDFVIAGYDPNMFSSFTDLYLNSSAIGNTVPSAPANLLSSTNGNSVTLTWNKSTDTQTQSDGLSYNVVISSYPNGQEIVSPNANKETGYRKIVDYGNTCLDTTYTFNYMPGGTVYWSVQAIDNNFEGSPFSAQATFVLPPLSPQLSLPVDSNFFVTIRPVFQWFPAVGATSYQFQLSDDVNFSNIIIDTDTITATSFQIQQDLLQNQQYFWKVKATNTSGTSEWSEIWTCIPDIDIKANQDVDVCLGINVQLSALVQGGNPPFTYLWTPGQNLNDSTVLNPIISTTNSTLCVVRVEDNAGWWATDTVLVHIRPLPVVVAGNDIAIWSGSNGIITASASNGTPPYTYSWSPSASLQGANSQNPIASPTSYTQYLVNVTDDFGCSSLIPDTVAVDVMTITEIIPGITGFLKANMSLGDYDNDNDLDLLISGQTTTNYVSATKLYRNDNGNFSEVAAGLDQSFTNPACWADFDNDGDLDIFSTYWSGITLENGYTIYENDNGNFTDQNLHLPLLTGGDAKPIDYDNDGDLDIIASGSLFNSHDTVVIFVNDNGAFTVIDAGMISIREGKIAVTDFDKDGDMDVAIAGTVNAGLYGGTPLFQLYKNENGTFTEVAFNRTEIRGPALSWGDINYDGYDDLMASGFYISGYNWHKTYLYTNTDTSLLQGNSNTLNVANGSFGIGDFDNDGDNDCVQSGVTQSNAYPYTYKPVANIYRNEAGVFINPNISLMGMENSATAIGDYDNDGDLDIFMAGKDTLNNPSVRIYKIDHVLVNKKPDMPTGLQAQVNQNKIILSWNRPLDFETRKKELKFNVRIGTTPTGSEITSAMSDITTGYVRTPGLTNVCQDTTYRIELLSAGVYYWGVQAVDNGKSGSLFANGTFTVNAMNCPELITPTAYSENIEAITNFTWTQVNEALQYRIQITEDPLFEEIFKDTTVTSQTNYMNYQKMILSTQYYWRVKALASGNSSGWSAIGHFRTKPQFILVNDSLSSTSHNTVRCGDFDNDDDMDIAYTAAIHPTLGYETMILQNTDGTFSKLPNSIMGVQNTYNFDWGDYDRDGNIDILVSGADANNWPFTEVYKNNGDNTFTGIGANLPPVKLGSSIWGDYDNDGDLDILLNGASYTMGSNSYNLNDIYQNINGVFTPVEFNLPSVLHGVSMFYDFNNDGLLDIAVIGNYNDSISGTSYPIFKIFRNNSNSFIDINDSSLVGMFYVSIDFGDYNSDGYVDIATLGSTGNINRLIIYTNNAGNSFTPIISTDFATDINEVRWGDYDNDGDLDLIVPSVRYAMNFLQAYRNDNGVFKLKDIDLKNTDWGSYSWIDYDKDHDLDLITTGLIASNTTGTRLYKNNSAVANQPPSTPGNLHAEFQGSNLLLQWDSATDSETPSSGLTYNIAVGHTAQSTNILNPMSNITNGYKKTVTSGNCSTGNTAIVKGLIPGNTYYVSVQAVDNCFEGSAFSVFSAVVVPELQINSENIQVYPNPSDGKIWITLTTPEEDEYVVSLQDCTGRCVYKKSLMIMNNTPAELNLTGFTRGIYLLKVKNNIRTSVTKIIIQ